MGERLGREGKPASEKKLELNQVTMPVQTSLESSQNMLGKTAVLTLPKLYLAPYKNLHYIITKIWFYQTSQSE